MRNFNKVRREVVLREERLKGIRAEKWENVKGNVFLALVLVIVYQVQGLISPGAFGGVCSLLLYNNFTVLLSE